MRRRASPHPPLRGTLSLREKVARAPTAAIVFYRALVQAGQTEPVDALCAALAERGPDAAAALRLQPEGEGGRRLRRGGASPSTSRRSC